MNNEAKEREKEKCKDLLKNKNLRGFERLNISHYLESLEKNS